MNLISLFLSIIAASQVCANIDEFDPTKMKLRKLSLGYPFIDDGFHIKDWDYGGNAVVEAFAGVHLTTDLPSHKGWLWSTRHLPNDSWIVDFDFKIGSLNKDRLFGDGLAFWATTERANTGPVFGNKNFFNGLGIFFDTYRNGNHNRPLPLVVGMKGDGKTSYDFSSDGLSASFASSDTLEYRQTEGPVKARITYVKGKHLSVKLKKDSEFVECFSVNDFTLPENLYLGLSAVTGQLSDFHTITYIKTRNVTEEEAKQILTPMPQFAANSSTSLNSSFWPTFIKLAIVCSIIGAALYAYKAYNKKKYRRL
ncbi:L-type lectin-like domain-containing protein [Smittium culicis]|uniref:L-type lectin-like domain-containing protein n=1 Tax=Smittium culicis TaxID=133412 RepID=A0A1R1YII8_9FUNG|nr:L-type lectin-like domain-containing protein [Smittium culicis]